MTLKIKRDCYEQSQQNTTYKPGMSWAKQDMWSTQPSVNI